MGMRMKPERRGRLVNLQDLVGPARMIAESLTPKPGIREQTLPGGGSRRGGSMVELSGSCKADEHDLHNGETERPLEGSFDFTS